MCVNTKTNHPQAEQEIVKKNVKVWKACFVPPLCGGNHGLEGAATTHCDLAVFGGISSSDEKKLLPFLTKLTQ